MAEASRIPGRRLRVLVAEDNRINQLLATRILEKAGHVVVLVADGRQALVALEGSPFDMVLMDVHMPVMDGLAATAEIRRRESATGARRLPIVGLTAHTDNRAVCLAAGMDEYLTKPVTSQTLIAVLSTIAATTASEPPSFDVGAALEFTAGDVELLRELLAVFTDDAPAQLEAVRAAAARKDATGLRNAAHSVKGSLRVLGAERSAALAQELEQLGEAGRLDDADDLAATLAAEVQRLLTEVGAWLATEGPAAVA